MADMTPKDYPELVADCAAKDAALKDVKDAWEVLNEGRYSHRTIERWLKKDMKPAIDAVRQALKDNPGAALLAVVEAGQKLRIERDEDFSGALHLHKVFWLNLNALFVALANLDGNHSEIPDSSPGGQKEPDTDLFNEMSKAELDAYAMERFGVDLDHRRSLKFLRYQLRELSKKAGRAALED